MSVGGQTHESIIVSLLPCLFVLVKIKINVRLSSFFPLIDNEFRHNIVETLALQKGTNFALAPKKIPIAEIVAAVENGISGLPVEGKLALRSQVSQILQRASVPPTNLPQAELRSLHKLRSSDGLPPRFYGLPKIHKPGYPLRPIVSFIDSPTYMLSKHLAQILRPLLGNTDLTVKNSVEFCEQIKNVKLEVGDELLSFDVVSLFTSIPVELAC